MDASATAPGDGTEARPLRTISSGVARARATGTSLVLVAAGTYAERLTIDVAVAVRGSCSGSVVLAPPDDDRETPTVTVTSDATLSGITVSGRDHALAFAPVGGASLTLERVRIRGHRRGIEAVRTTTPKVPWLRVSDVSIAGAELGISTQIPFDAKRLQLRDVAVGAALQADGALEAAVVEDATELGLGVDGARVELRRCVVRRIGRGSSAGGEGLAALPPRGAGVSDVSIDESIFSEIEGAAVSVHGGRVVVRQTSLRDGILPASGKNLAAGLRAFDDGALVAEDTTILRSAFVGVISNGAPIELRRVLVRDVSEPFGSAIALVPGEADGAATLDQVLVERSLRAGLFVDGRKVLATDLRVRDVRVDDLGLFGDGITVEGNAAVDLVRPSVERAARAALSTFGGAVTLRDARLCGSFALESNPKYAGSRIDDRGNNVCGCTAPLSRCRITQSGLEPVPPPP